MTSAAPGVTVKALMSTGYGGDLVTGGPGAVQAAQGVYFLTSFEPVEMNTAATQQFQNDLKTYAGVTTAPTFAEYQGYVSIDAFVQGLKAAGSNPTQASLINAMLGMTNYDGAGLWGTHTLSFALADTRPGFRDRQLLVDRPVRGHHVPPGLRDGTALRRRRTG